jgi:hypothetical protein
MAVWKLPLLSVLADTYSCRTLHYVQPPASHASPLIEGRASAQLGNTPLLFSQVEYAKAAMAQAGITLDPGPRRRS